MLYYEINKGINKPMEFIGLRAQYIVYLAGGWVLALLLFALSYLTGWSMYLGLALAGGLGTGVFVLVSHLDRRYGEHGLMKRLAQRQLPGKVVVRNRRIFRKLID